MMKYMDAKDSDQIEFDFLPLTLSIETLGGLSVPLVLRGTPLPTKRSQNFSTVNDDQKDVEIIVLLGERILAKNNMKIGSCSLKGIQDAPKGSPQVRVTLELNRSCDIKVEAVEVKSGNKIEAKFEKMGASLTSELIQQLLREAEENRIEDKARSVIALAEQRIRKDQESGALSATTKQIETLVAEIGLALMNANGVLLTEKTKALEELLAKPGIPYSPFGFGGYGDIFDAFFGAKPPQKIKQFQQTTTPASSKTMKGKAPNSLATVAAHTSPVIQSFLENLDLGLEQKRSGAWEAIESNGADSLSQASHSMRELLRQLLDKLAPTEYVLKAPWYNKPKEGSPVTRAMRIHYAIAGTSEVSSESTLSLINDLAAAVDSMYAKLSAESHSDKKAKVQPTKMYLFACEAVIGLIATERNVV